MATRAREGERMRVCVVRWRASEGGLPIGYCAYHRILWREILVEIPIGLQLDRIGDSFVSPGTGIKVGNARTLTNLLPYGVAVASAEAL